MEFAELVDAAVGGDTDDDIEGADDAQQGTDDDAGDDGDEEEDEDSADDEDSEYEFEDEEDEEGEGDDKPGGKLADTAPTDATPEEPKLPELPTIPTFDTPKMYRDWTVSADGYTLSEGVFENPQSEGARALRGELKDDEGNPVALSDPDTGEAIEPWGPDGYRDRREQYFRDKQAYEGYRIGEAENVASRSRVQFGEYEEKFVGYFADHVLKPLVGDEGTKSIVADIRAKAMRVLQQDASETIEAMVAKGMPRNQAFARVSEYTYTHPEIVGATIREAVAGTPQNLREFTKSLADAIKKELSAPIAKPGDKPAVRAKQVAKNGNSEGSKDRRPAPADRNATPHRSRPPSNVRESASPNWDQGGGGNSGGAQVSGSGNGDNGGNGGNNARKVKPSAEEVAGARAIGMPDDAFAGRMRRK